MERVRSRVIEKPGSVDIGKECNTVEDQELDLMTEEILLVLKEMKNNNAEGPDNIPAEMLKCLYAKATAVLIDICKRLMCRSHVHNGVLASRLRAVNNVTQP